ncbi:glycoside hydrolase domain-containing protein [Streptomyces liangshanensis]|uniref:glycoside hydrolase domain-containing protein n=1 Tax=Streptomyces liangshanensis TaxID=2717324 RepID=UPI0036DB9808
MADEMVLRAQRFINTTYNNGASLGISKLNENGQTGWPVMYALTRALQYEMGITALSDSFGPTTLAAIGEKYGKIDDTNAPSANFCRIIQSALYCKGYDGGDIDGFYNARVKASVALLHQRMGVAGTYPGSSLWPKTTKGLFNLDAYVTVGGGSETIRSIQQWLNGRYILRKDFYIIPCDGHHSRDVAKSMLFAIQYELGMADGVANGVFGPGTQSGLKDHTVTTGSSGVWVQLFSAGMVLNQRPVSFTNSFTSTLASAVSGFQSFVKLPVTGKGDFSTWASLLVSYGDQNRTGAACDGVTLITPARAQTLKSQGITYVGRYLTNPDPTPPDSLKHKEIQPGELQTIADNGLRCFPIYQTYGRDASGFSYPSGRADGQAGVNAARDHGFKAGTRIFFAVDFDALDYQVTDNVLPYFKGIEDAMAANGGEYSVGVYGPRNVCTRVGEAGHSSASFVSDMSSGFSGNFGYPLPEDWAYDQVVTRTVGSGDGSINIDIDIASGRDIGQNSFNPPASQALDVLFNTGYWSQLLADVRAYMESIGFAEDDGRLYTTTQCLETIIAGDLAVTNTARAYGMRKALIQTTAFWEFRHYGNEDLIKDAGVWWYHQGVLPGWAQGLPVLSKFQDSSTGVAQMFGFAGICAWNNSIRTGLVTGTVKDSTKNADIFSVWDKLRTDNDFALTSVAHAHIWAADGKPGGDEEARMERRPTLDYTESEIYEVLRRYQGPAEPAFTDATKRMPLYYIFEKYNRIAR